MQLIIRETFSSTEDETDVETRAKVKNSCHKFSSNKYWYRFIFLIYFSSLSLLSHSEKR